MPPDLLIPTLPTSRRTQQEETKMNQHSMTIRGKERYRSGVMEYKKMGYWEPDYVPKDTDIIAMFRVPAGYTFDGNVKLTVPLTAQTYEPEKAEMVADGKMLKLTFEKGLIDNNVPAGQAVPFAVSANFLHGGVQKKLASTANVRVTK